MSKIHLVPASIYDGAPLEPIVVPKHPVKKDASIFYCSIDRFLEHNNAVVGDIYAYFSAFDYVESFHDPDLPYGTSCISGGCELRYGGHVVTTLNGWDWVVDMGLVED